MDKIRRFCERHKINSTKNSTTISNPAEDDLDCAFANGHSNSRFGEMSEDVSSSSSCERLSDRGSSFNGPKKNPDHFDIGDAVNVGSDDRCLTVNSAGGRHLDQSEDSCVSVKSYSVDDTKAWRVIRSQLVIEPVKPLDINKPVRDTHVRFVCISDTHSKIEKLDVHSRSSRHPTVFIPNGDVLLHAGDFTMLGEPTAVERFNTYLGSLPHKHKIVIAGNHELSFDEDCCKLPRHFHGDYHTSVSAMKALLTNCIYLEDTFTHVCGIKIYGSPWQPEFRQWAFNVPRGQPSLDIWNKIPSDTEVLMTHGPPMGYGDCTKSGARVGCLELLNTVQQRVKPRYHVFGHIHEGYGVYSDGVTTYINASTCTTKYWPVNKPVIFDIPLKEGFSK